MKGRKCATFRDYLRSLPEELLETVSEDYVWLSIQGFAAEASAEFVWRRECCRDECLRRGVPDLYRFAEEVISPWAA
jgi:hypothetical protein